MLMMTAEYVGADLADLVRSSGVQGGLVVHVGCGDARATAALRANDSYLVHGLDTDAAKVAEARRYIASLGVYGKVSVAKWEGSTLPYTDNVVNLLVIEDRTTVPQAEIVRVLAPNGVAYAKAGERWTQTTKPWPDDIDEWTHFLHDAGNNAVARDARVAPPRHMQWLAEPEWARYHHTLASISGVVSAGGRIFYILDEGPAGSMAVPASWVLVARDAFSGVLLWKRPIPSWSWYQRGFRSGPVQLARTLVAQDERVYVPLGLDVPLTTLDAATGETVATYARTENTEEIILHDGLLLVVTGAPATEQAVKITRRQSGMEGVFPNTKSIAALRADTRELLWKWTESEPRELMPLTLAATDRGVFFQAGEAVVCLDRSTGQERWRSAATGDASKRSVGWSVATLVAHDGVVLWADGKQVTALSAGSGETLWECPCQAGFKSPVDVFAIGDLVWIGPDFAVGRDLRTGEVKRENIPTSDLWTAGHHHRCYREKATERYLMTGKRGIEFFDLIGGQHSRNNWIRGLCQYGIMPCNGLIYAPAHACGCYMESQLHGFWALAAERDLASGAESSASEGERLQRGPAYATPIQNAESSTQNPDDWPTYRRDVLRSGTTGQAVPTECATLWGTKLGGRLSPPVVAGGLVLVAAVDEHRVIALDAQTGRPRWEFTAGARVDSPPTLYSELALFGCADGWVYCLRASDGALVWRYRAAPSDRRTVALDQVESLWPVHGSVLVKDGVAYVAAGRSSYLDGGIVLYGLDPRTGRILCETTVRSEHPGPTDLFATDGGDRQEKIDQNTVDYKTYNAPDRSDSFSTAGGATTDVLVSDGTSIYMRQMRFDAGLTQQEKGGRHLFSTSRLLDDAENHRSHWMLGVADFSRMTVAYSWIADSGGTRKDLNLVVPYGLLLAFDDATVWGVRRARNFGYQLFADENRPFSANEEALPDFRREASEIMPRRKWAQDLPLRPRSLLRAGDKLLVAGMPQGTDQGDLRAAFEGEMGGVLRMVSTADGTTLAERQLDSPPVWDGMAVSAERLYIATVAGDVICMGD
jgi:outer membrane protein assembly factor BamB